MNRTRVAVTIDVENPQTPLFERRFRDNRIWSEGWGIEKIIEVLDASGAVGDFFVNVYEYVIWGRDEMERIVRTIHDAGHRVHLHTHPIWIDDKRRENMYQFPLEEQTSIIAWGADFVESCTGQRPAAHRAGAYGLNADTLRACRKAGIGIDSSYHFGHPNCRHTFAENTVVLEDGLVELPVTVLRNHSGAVTKTDLDWVASPEFVNFLGQVHRHPEMWFVNLFLHSYSLTRTYDQFASCEPDEDGVRRLSEMLTHVSEDAQCLQKPLQDAADAALARRDVGRAVDGPSSTWRRESGMLDLK